MATRDEDDLVICSICIEKFTNPKYLPCLHTFCHLCLKSYIVSQLGGGGKPAKPFPCPVCRQTVQINDMSLSSEEIADNMPKNYLITSLMERSRALKIDDERSCDPCNRDNQNSRAVSWCKECSEALCENCSLCHNRFKESKNHETVPIADAVKQQPVKIIDNVDEPWCIDHDGKVLEVYCVDHKQMCCVICLATKHRKCENISTFEEMIKRTKVEDTIEDFIKHLKGVVEKTEVLRITAEENLQNLEQQQEEITDKVSTTVKLAKDKLERLEESFVLQLKQTHKQQNTRATHLKETMESFQTYAEKGIKMIQTACEQESPKQMFIAKEKLKTQLEDHSNRLKKELDKLEVVEYKLYLNDTVTSLINCLSSIAEVELSTSPSFEENVDGFFTALNNVCTEHIPKVDIMDIEVAKCFSIDIGNAEVPGGTFLPDGKLVLCDITNYKLVMYDKAGDRLFESRRLPNCPWDVACFSSFEIVVSFRNASCLKKYEVTPNAFKELNIIRCKNCPLGVDVINGNIVVAHSNCIDIKTQEGVTLSTISRKYGGPYYVVVSKSTGAIYYSEGDAIVCGSPYGEHFFKCSHPLLKRPSGIALDRCENVFVCGYGSSNVHLVSSDGKKNRILIQHIDDPTRIGFSADGKRFFISCVGSNRSVNIYRFINPE